MLLIMSIGLLYILLSWSYGYSKEMINEQVKISLNYSNSLAKVSLENYGKELMNIERSIIRGENFHKLINAKKYGIIEKVVFKE